jgi:hypothetical protein
MITVATATEPEKAKAEVEASYSRRLSTFAVLTALAVVAWHAQTSVPFGIDWQTAGLLVALAVLIRPGSRRTFLALALVQTIAVLIALPSINTDRLLQLFIFAAIASTGLYVYICSGLRQLNAEKWLEPLQPLLRLQLVIVYGLAAWHKLNLDFFNPQSSCAVLLFDQTPFWHLYAQSNVLRWALIAGTITTEATLPALLSIRRTRNFAVCYGMLFHMGLALSGFYSFSMTMISLLFLFTPPGFCDGVVEYWKNKDPRSRRAIRNGLVVVLSIAAVFGLARCGATMVEAGRQRGALALLNAFWLQWGQTVGYWAFFAYVLPLALYLWIWHRLPLSFTPVTKCFSPIPLVFWILPALLIFDGLNPYLGLKTDTAFAMYSNLRSEGETTNHLIWRHPLALANYQRDLVQVVESNVPALESIAQRGLPIPFIELRQRISRLARSGQSNISLTYIRNGQTMRSEAAERDRELGARPSFLERKLLSFRTITTQGCPH